MYKLTTGTAVLRLTDNASIPEDTGNRDYSAYLQWLTDGNVPEPADPEPAPNPLEQIEAIESASGMVRVVRDFMLGAIEAEAAKRGLTYAQLKAVNPGYRKVKEMDEQIVALRSQL